VRSELAKFTKRCGSSASHRTGSRGSNICSPDYASHQEGFAQRAQMSDADLTVHEMPSGVNHRLGSDGAGLLSAPERADWAIHGLTTFVAQPYPASADCFPAHAAFAIWQGGRLTHCPFRGLLMLHSCYGPPDRSAPKSDPCHEAPALPVTRSSRRH
jgi:hypothetical protein